jgi:Ner family transcriptional regulator
MEHPMDNQDWHPADIAAALTKRGHTLAGLSVANGYHPTAAGKALKTPWRAMEMILAEAIGVAPETIWPSRYTGAERPILRQPRTLVQAAARLLEFARQEPTLLCRGSAQSAPRDAA